MATLTGCFASWLCSQSRRRPSFLPQIIASRVVLSPMGNGRAHLTACDAEMAQRCKRDNALV